MTKEVYVCECFICWSMKEGVVVFESTQRSNNFSITVFQSSSLMLTTKHISHTHIRNTNTHERRIPDAVYLYIFVTSYLQRVVQKGFFMLPSSPQRCCFCCQKFCVPIDEIDEQRWVLMTTTIKKKRTTRTMMRMDILLAYDACAPFFHFMLLSIGRKSVCADVYECVHKCFDS